MIHRHYMIEDDGTKQKENLVFNLLILLLNIHFNSETSLLEEREQELIKGNIMVPNKDLLIKKIKISKYKSGIIFYGTYGDNLIKLHIDSLNEEFENIKFKFVLVGYNIGIYLFDSNVLCCDSKPLKEYPQILHYDTETLKSLIEDFDMSFDLNSDDCILENSIESLNVLGFEEPDDSYFIELDDLNATSNINLLQQLLNNLSCSELLNLFINATKLNYLNKKKTYFKSKY